jgi:thiol:disulfide interchange protein
MQDEQNNNPQPQDQPVANINTQNQPGKTDSIQDTNPSTSQQPNQTSSNPREDPGKTLGIVSLVLAFIIPLLGLIFGFVARSKSKKAGHSNGLALVGIIISILSMIVFIFIFAVLIFGVGQVVNKCSELGPGTHVENGVTYTCGAEFMQYEDSN